MYEDYDLDYRIPQYEYDLDETYDAWVQSFSNSNLDEEFNLDEEYARDTEDYNALAYRHYA